MIEDILRVYLDPADILTWPEDKRGYPLAWQHELVISVSEEGAEIRQPRIPNLVRELAGHRCVRCGHPFEVKVTPGEWSPCDVRCTHGGPIRWQGVVHENPPATIAALIMEDSPVPQAQWRILTVHHLNGVKHDCRWWNLAALCQRCHLVIQAKVHMERPWTREHSEWFKPYAAGYYAWRFLGLELTREETMGRLEELLALEDRQLSIEGHP